MAESSTPSGAEQLHIVQALLRERSNSTQEQYRYFVSACWIHKWLDHVTHSDNAVYPGMLTMLMYKEYITLVVFDDLGALYLTTRLTNMWVREPIWCKWVQWYGVDDSHVLTRCMTPGQPRWKELRISLKGDLSARVASTLQVFSASEKCGYIELQLRRIFGVTDATETQLWLQEQARNPLVLDRSKELMHYTAPKV